MDSGLYDENNLEGVIETIMIKLPISDYASDYYKKQGIEFTFRQQAHICWFYNDLLKDQLESLKEILKISDDEKLNTEIRERVEYEEKAYECFMTNCEQGCFYILYPEDGDEDDTEYFASAKNAISYGIRHVGKEFKIEKCCLFDMAQREQQEEGADDDPENVRTILSRYCFTPEGDIRCGISFEYEIPFDEMDYSRFEKMFLCIKSPFACGDIVMGPDFDEPRVVYTDHDCFEELYNRLKDLDVSDNCIRTDWISIDGKSCYDHTFPLDLWVIDSWDDEEYWHILQLFSKIAKTDGDIFNLEYYIDDYVMHHSDNGRR